MVCMLCSALPRRTGRCAVTIILFILVYTAPSDIVHTSQLRHVQWRDLQAPSALAMRGTAHHALPVTAYRLWRLVARTMPRLHKHISPSMHSA
jgi:hypothetical protein